MKHIKTLDEAFYQNWHDAPDPPEPERDTNRKDSERKLKCIAYTPYLALLASKSNPKELYLVQMEDPDVEDWLMEGGYSWEYSYEGPDWDDQVDGDCIVDLVDDTMAGKLKPFETSGKYKRKVEPLKVGEGVDSYIRYGIPGAEDMENDEPENYAAIVKVDLPLAQYLEKEFEYRAYEHIHRNYPNSRLGKKAKAEYLKMLGALMRAFPEIE